MRNKFFKIKDGQGFTLIEIMVSVTITLVVVGGGLASYTQLVQRQLVANQGRGFLAALRDVQKRAQSGDKPESCAGELEGWRIESVDQSSYRVAAICGGGIEGEEVVVMPPEVAFGSGIFSMTFLVLDGGVTGAGTISVQDLPGEYSYQVEVSSGGSITELGITRKVGTAQEFSLPSPTPEPGVGELQDVKLNPVADAFVYRGRSNRNYGRDNLLEVEGSPIYLSYLKFDLTQLAGREIEEARLLLRVVDGTRQAVRFKKVNDSSWDERGINYANRPGLSSTVVTMNGNGNRRNVWVDVDMTGWVDDNAGSVATFGVDTSGGDDFRFRSKDSSQKPELRISYR